MLTLHKSVPIHSLCNITAIIKHWCQYHQERLKMFNKRKLDELIDYGQYDPEEDCGYTFEEFLAIPEYREHVFRYVNEALMPKVLSQYLYEDCYYDDLETVRANLNYVNSAMRKRCPFMNWTDISMETILEEIEWLKNNIVKDAESSTDPFDFFPN